MSDVKLMVAQYFDFGILVEQIWSNAARICPPYLIKFVHQKGLFILPSLLKSHPKIAEEWDYDANAPLTPDQVTSGSGKRVWWICKRGVDHKWITAISNRQRTGCPFCSNRRVSVTNSLENLFPDVASVRMGFLTRLAENIKHHENITFFPHNCISKQTQC